MSRLSLFVLALFLFVALPARAQDESGAPQLSGDLTFEQWQKLPEKVRYTPGGPIPTYYEQRRMIKKAMAITGGSILGGVYLSSTLAAVVDPALYPMLIPVVGPFITIATAAPQFGYEPAAVWLLTMTGIAEATGLVLLYWGLADKGDWLVKKPYGFASLYVVPTVGPEFAGGLVRGRF